MKEQTELESLVSTYLLELRERGYCPGSLWKYGKICRLFTQWCKDRSIYSMTEETARRYCTETIGSFVCDHHMDYQQRYTIRVIRMLLTYQEHGDFEIRTPRKEYIFKTSLAKIVELYFSYCSEKCHLASGSIRDRRSALYRYDTYLHERGLELADVSVELFEQFTASDLCGRRKTYKSYLKELYRYLYDIEFIDKDYSSYILKEPKIHEPSKVPTTYTDDEIRKMLSAINRGTAKGKRDYLVVLLAAEYGLRASDITSLSLENIDWDKNTITLDQYKTGEPLSLPLLSSVGNAIIDYLQNGRPPGGENTIIVQHENARRGQRLKSPTIHSIVSEALKNANIPNWKEKKHGPHALRHSLASNMLKRGASFPVISTVLGHRSTETTKHYISVDIERLRECSLPIPKMSSIYFRKEASNGQ